jgi:hypothetical protein
MSTITRASFNLIWTTAYPSLLGKGSKGRLVSPSGFTSTFTGHPELRRPWDHRDGNPGWSFFWAYYLVADQLRSLSANAAFDRFVPFRDDQDATIAAPAGVNATAQASVLVYPTAISVVIGVNAAGNWAVGELASALSDLRTRKDWSLTRGGETANGRSLFGIAQELRDHAATWLVDGEPPPPDPPIPTTVAAPLAASGTAALLELTNDDAKACLAGLSVLGPPGELDPTALFDKSKNANHAGQIYALSGGHAIWAPANMLAQPANDPIGCLLANETALVMQISALSTVVAWAYEQIQQGTDMTDESQALASRAATRLGQLQAGDPRKTYRSKLAVLRTSSLTDAITKVSYL